MKKQFLARFTTVTVQQCADLARTARGLLEQNSLELDAQSDLEQMIRDVEFLASFSSDPFTREGAWGADKQRTVRAFLRLEQTRRLVGTLAQVPLIKNAEAHLKWLRKRLDRLRKKTVEGLREREAEDFLFELEIAGRFAGWTRHEVSLEEPDIVLTAGGHRTLLPCKRPRSIKSLKRAILQATKQLAPDGSGFILIGSEYLLHAQDEFGRPATIVKVPTPADAVDEGSRILAAAAESARPEIQKAFKAGVGGILFIGALIYFSHRPAIFGYRWLGHKVANCDIPFAPELLTVLQEILTESYPTQERLEQLFAAADQATTSPTR